MDDIISGPKSCVVGSASSTTSAPTTTATTNAPTTTAIPCHYVEMEMNGPEIKGIDKKKTHLIEELMFLLQLHSQQTQCMNAHMLVLKKLIVITGNGSKKILLQILQRMKIQSNLKLITYNSTPINLQM